MEANSSIGVLHMLGMVFVTFTDWTESVYGEAMVDDLLTHIPLEGGGAYTAVGQYPYEDVIKLMSGLSQRVGQPLPELCIAFGKTMLQVLMQKHASMMPAQQSLLDFLQSLQNHIHAEVVKLYPEAQPPQVTCEARQASSVILRYSSERPLADLAEGLLLGAIDYFGQPARLVRTNEPGSGGTRALFTLELLA